MGSKLRETFTGVTNRTCFYFSQHIHHDMAHVLYRTGGHSGKPSTEKEKIVFAPFSSSAFHVYSDVLSFYYNHFQSIIRLYLKLSFVVDFPVPISMTKISIFELRFLKLNLLVVFF